MDKEQIASAINAMTVDEMKRRLAEYMQNDSHLKPSIAAIEVRLCQVVSESCRYEVVLRYEDGEETVVKFHNRYSRLFYIYTLLHPEGYQRYKLIADGFSAMSRLYSTLYFKSSEAMMKTIGDDPKHFISHYIAQSRNAIRQATPHADDCMIAFPQKHNGKLLISFVERGGKGYSSSKYPLLSVSILPKSRLCCETSL